MLPSKMRNLCIDLERHAEMPPKLSERENSSIPTTSYSFQKPISKAQEFTDKKKEMQILIPNIIYLQKLRKLFIILVDAMSGLSLIVAFPALAFLPIKYNSIGAFILMDVVEVILDCAILINTFDDLRAVPIKSIKGWRCRNRVSCICLLMMIGIVVCIGLLKLILPSKANGVVLALNNGCELFVMCSCGCKCPLLLGVVVIGWLVANKQQRLNILDALTMSMQQINEL